MHVSSVPEKAVSFSDQVSFAETEGGVEAERDFDYIESESSSELLTCDEAEDAENLEAVFGALLCAGSPPNLGFRLRNENHSSV